MTTTRRPRTLLTPLAVLGACALLAACGGGSGGGSNDAARPAAASGGSTSAEASDSGSSDAGGSTGSAPDPCSLVTAAELSSAYGVTFGEGAASDSDVAAQRGFRACKWEDSTGTKSFLLQTVASGDPLGESAGELFDQSKDLYPEATDGGAGDKSLLLKDNGGFLAVKGDVFVQGNGIIFGADVPGGASATILQTVVGQLD